MTVDVKEGAVCQLTATNQYSMPFTWTSSNTTVATVSSTGMVTANKSGETTITASYVQAATTYTITCKVYVYIDVGAFYIKNNFSGYYLNVQNGIITHIKDNTIRNFSHMDTANQNSYVSTSEITEATEKKAKKFAAEEIKNINDKYSVTKQRVDKYYDIVENKYYCKIISEYVTPEGLYGAIVSMYEV